VKCCAISGLVKEAFSNASKFDLLSEKIIVEPGSFAALPETLVSDESRMVG
jgi:hypothetical protein